jgi:phosphoribosylamine---glycine ligase
MRFLGVGEWNDLGDMYMRLIGAGHEVRVHIAEAEGRDILAGMVPLIEDWRAELDWVREAGRDGIVLFEGANTGETQDQLRGQGFQVIGGSAEGDRLENERAYAQQVMSEAGMRTAATHEFDNLGQAIDFIRANPARYVAKFNGGMTLPRDNYVGQLDDGRDVIAALEAASRRWHGADSPSLILMEHLVGVEIGTGAYFDGERFLRPACLDWEHKRFFNGDLGELTGEMGTLVTYRGAERLFEATLGRMEGRLRRAGHCGYVNINTIVNDAGIWPLEFTCRFGYPGYAILDALHAEGWDRILARMAHGSGTEVATHPGFAVGVVLTVPPFPYRADYGALSKGVPVLFREEPTEDDRHHFHWVEVARIAEELVTSGVVGEVAIVTGRGESVEDAQKAAYARAGNIIVPNIRYRTDIGDRFRRSDRSTLRRLKLL